MKTYNKIMINLWLVLTIVLTVFITYKCFTEGFNRWAFMYLFPVITFLSYLMRKFMAKRVEKHMETLKEQENNSSK